MINLALYQPEIPPNTGNLIRLCACTGVPLHLVHPLGFQINDRALLRAGLDYHEFASVQQYASLEALRAALPQARLLAFTTRGATRYDQVAYAEGDVLLFGPETRGLPQSLLDELPAAQRVYLPMQPGTRSLNLANAAAIAVYEALRQLRFGNLQAPKPHPPLASGAR